MRPKFEIAPEIDSRGESKVVGGAVADGVVLGGVKLGGVVVGVVGGGVVVAVGGVLVGVVGGVFVGVVGGIFVGVVGTAGVVGVGVGGVDVLRGAAFPPHAVTRTSRTPSATVARKHCLEFIGPRISRRIASFRVRLRRLGWPPTARGHSYLKVLCFALTPMFRK